MELNRASAPSPAPGELLRFNFFTQNIWGLPDFLGARNPILHSFPIEVPSRSVRIAAIAETFVNYDILVFQEVWMHTDAQHLRTAGQKFGLNYSQYYKSASFAGTGLMILSRFPIQSAAYYPYTINGKPQRLQHGDWHARKGAAHAKLLLSARENISIDVYVTHLISQYKPHEDDEYYAHRVVQCLELCDIIHQTRTTPFVVAAGDFNCRPKSVEYNILTRYGGLVDSYSAVHPDHDESMGSTHDIDVFLKDPPKRIDYVFVKSFDEDGGMIGPSSFVHCRPIASSVQLRPKPIDYSHSNSNSNGHKPSHFVYSDHFAVTTHFAIEERPIGSQLPKMVISASSSTSSSSSSMSSTTSPTPSPSPSPIPMSDAWRLPQMDLNTPQPPPSSPPELGVNQPIVYLSYQSVPFSTPSPPQEKLRLLRRAQTVLRRGLSDAHRRHRRHQFRAVLSLALISGIFAARQYIPQVLERYISQKTASIISTISAVFLTAESFYCVHWKKQECENIKRAMNRYLHDVKDEPDVSEDEIHPYK